MKLEQANSMTLQELVDYGINKIVEQGKRCLFNNNDCAYGDTEGNHCYIGWLLDEDDDELMSAIGSIGSINSRMPYKIPNLISENIHLFTGLQSFHDTFIDRSFVLNILKTEYGNVVSFDNPNFQKWIELEG